MPAYELFMIVRKLPKQELLACLKRTANMVWAENGAIKKIEYLGMNSLPYKGRSNTDTGVASKEGNYFIMHVSMNPVRFKNLRPEMKLDVDLITSKFVLTDHRKLPDDHVCTLEEELLPPAYRPSVKPLLENHNVMAEPR